MRFVYFIRRLVCGIRGHHRPEWALDPFTGYWTVCVMCGDRQLRVEIDP